MPDPLPAWDTSDVAALRPFSRVRLIALDIDGTLLSTPMEALSTLIASLRGSLNAAGRVVVTIATGRALGGAERLARELGLARGVPVILYNGGVVMRHETREVLFRRRISNMALARIVKLTEAHGATALTYVVQSPTESLFDFREEAVFAFGAAPPFDVEFNGIPLGSAPAGTDGLEPVAVLVRSVPGLEARASLLGALVRVPEISCTTSGGDYIEIRPRRSNKGVALRVTARLLAMRREEVLALGDNDNDAEMLAWAGIGVSVWGASPLAVACSDHYAAHGAVLSAAQVLRLVKHARRLFPSPRP